MRILIACETSGQLRKRFYNQCHEVYSCDLLPCQDPEHPSSEFHIQGDVRGFLDQEWDLIIAHPDCTYLTGSAAWAFSDGPYHQKVKPGTLVGADRRKAREDAIAFAELIWSNKCERICIENPVGSLSTMSKLGKATQYVQPYDFGDDASKKTGLWLKGLPPLVPTGGVAPRLVDGKPRWGNQTDSGQNKLSPSPDRWQKRSDTFNGIADAMVQQWGELK